MSSHTQTNYINYKGEMNMRTTNKEFKAQVQEHILDNLSTDEYTEPMFQLNQVVEEFKNWYSPYEKRQHPNRQEAFTNWLNGLPSCLHVEYMNYSINQTLKQWFENCGMIYKDRDSDKESELYRNLIYREFRTLCKKHNVELSF